MSTQEGKWLMKHIGTPFFDLPVTVRIDRKKKQVELSADFFDSWLVTNLVVNSLMSKGVDAFIDTRGGRNVYPSFRLVYLLAGTKFDCDVVRIRDYARKEDAITVVL